MTFIVSLLTTLFMPLPDSSVTRQFCDLAYLLLTETIHYSLYTSKLPVYALMLDAMSAFDKIVLECAVRNVYLAGTSDQGLLFLNSRLQNNVC